MGKIGQDAGAIALPKLSVWVKNLKCQKGAKYDCTTKLDLCAKNRSKKQLIFENKCIIKMAKIGHDEKAIAFAIWSVWDKNLKCQEGAKNDCTTH